jgi:hypothetical protein
MEKESSTLAISTVEINPPYTRHKLQWCWQAIAPKI